MQQQSQGRSGKLTLYIVIGLLLGIITGFFLNKSYVGAENDKLSNISAQEKIFRDSLKRHVLIVDPSKLEKANGDKLRLESLLSTARKKLENIDPSGKRAEFEKIGSEIRTLDKELDLVLTEMDMLADSSNAAYAFFKKQLENTSKTRVELTKARDKKLEWFSLLADIFLRLIKMIVAPLVFTTLVVGVARLGDIKTVGRVGGKTLLWFLSASFVSLLLGMVLVNYFQPGITMQLPLPSESTGIDKAALTLKDFIYHVFPSSFIDAMAKNEILQIVVFALFFGVAAASMGEMAHGLVHALEAASHVILKITGYVMKFAPLAVFGAMAAVIAKQGLGILKTYSIFIGEFYTGLAILWFILILAGGVFIGRRIVTLIKRIKEPVLLAFSTSSSEAAFPKTMMELERFGCKDKIVSFVLPLGYSFNLDGSMMYMTFASLFIAQSYGIHLDLGTQISMLLVLMLTSKGIAGVPRASLVVIAGTLATFNIPEAGLALLLGIDPLLDMGRSATNVVGNSIATAVVSKLENSLED
jgi:Na+/H+-dicarboxylate symporter